MLNEGVVDEDTDPETVAAGARGRGFGPTRPAEAQDDPTVQLSRMPVSFIRGESVSDPETVFDHRPEATRWREDTNARYDEMPPAPMPSASSERSSTTLARSLDHARAYPPLESPETPAYRPIIDPKTAVLAPLLGGAVGGFVFMLILLALYAGSP